MKLDLDSTSGFSLLELVIILAITAVLVQLAVPSYKAHIKRANELKEKVEELNHDLEVL